MIYFPNAPVTATAVTDQRRSGSAPDTALRFPTVAGTNLEGRAFMLPRDLEGAFNVVLIAFKREQQADVDTWTPFLRSLVSEHPSYRVYELPTLNRGYRLMRSFIDGGMARGIADKAARASTITLYIDKGTFKRDLGIRSEDEIVVLLVSADGRIRWRAKGPFRAAAALGLPHIKDVPVELLDRDFLLDHLRSHQIAN